MVAVGVSTAMILAWPLQDYITRGTQPGGNIRDVTMASLRKEVMLKSPEHDYYA
jgi:hypothetical protein